MERRRGPADVRAFLPLTHLAFHLLVALTEAPAHGYALVGRIRDQSGGLVDPGTGSFYSIIRRTVDAGLIDEVEAPRGTDRHRREYAITPLGRRVLEAEVSRLREQVLATSRMLARAPEKRS